MKAIFLGSIGTIADTSALQLKSFNLAFKKHRLEWVWSPTEYTEMLKIAGGTKRIQRYAAQRGEAVDVESIHLTKTSILFPYIHLNKKEYKPTPLDINSS